MKKINNLIKTIESWILLNGIEGVAGFIIGIILWILGYKVWAGLSFGVFAHKNWDIFKSWINKKI